MDPSDLLPRWTGLRDNLWAALLVSLLPFGASWVYTRIKKRGKLGPSWHWALFSAMEFLISLAGLVAIARYGFVSFIPTALLLLVPPLILFLREKRLRGKARRAELLPATTTPPAKATSVSVTASTRDLRHLYHTNEKLVAALSKKVFAVLDVRNVSTTNLEKVVARCCFPGGIEDVCVWSTRTGSPPFEPNTHEADLSAGNSRLLVIAQAFGSEELWARLPPEGEPFHLTSIMRGVSRDEGREEHILEAASQSGTLLTLPKGEPIPVVVSFQAGGFSQQYEFTLTFDAGKPVILSRAAAPPLSAPISDPRAIREHLESLPLLRREDATRAMVGKMTIWEGELHNLSRNLDNGITLYVRFAPGTGLHNCFRADCSETPSIGSLYAGDFVRVRGTIEFVGATFSLTGGEVIS